MPQHDGEKGITNFSYRKRRRNYSKRFNNNISYSGSLKGSLIFTKSKVGLAIINFFNFFNEIKGEIALTPKNIIVEKSKSKRITGWSLLPDQPDYCCGRAEELDQLKDMAITAEAGSVVPIYGLAGVGKTTLINQLAHNLIPPKETTFKDVVWVDVGPEPDLYAIVEELLDSLKILINSDRLKKAGFIASTSKLKRLGRIVFRPLLEEHFAEAEPEANNKPILLILDDVWENGNYRGSQIVAFFKEACPNAVILLTTCSKKFAINVGTRSKYKLNCLSDQEGGELLAELLLLEEGFSRTDPVLFKELSKILGGHPLALSLVAKHIQEKIKIAHKKSLEAVLPQQTKDYRERLGRLTIFNDLELGEGNERNENLERALSFLYEDLTKEDQRCFRALGIFTYNQLFSLKLLEAIWQSSSSNAEGTCDRLRLSCLLEETKSEPETAEDCYRLHPLLQAYARALFCQNQIEFDTVLTLYQKHVVEQIEQLHKITLPEWSWQIAFYLPHLRNVGAILFQRFTSQQIRDKQEQTIKIFIRIAEIEEARGERVTALIRYKVALKLSKTINAQKLRAEALRGIGLSYHYSGNQWKAKRALTQSIKVADRAGAISTKASALVELGLVYGALSSKRTNQWRNNLQKNKELKCLHQAQLLVLEDNHKDTQGTILNNIAMVYMHQEPKELDEALKLLKKAQAVYSEVNSPIMKATVINNTGLLYKYMKDFRQALKFYNEASMHFQKLKYKVGIISTHANQGISLFELGNKQEGLTMIKQALTKAKEEKLGRVAERIEPILTDLERRAS